MTMLNGNLTIDNCQVPLGWASTEELENIPMPVEPRLHLLARIPVDDMSFVTTQS